MCELAPYHDVPIAGRTSPPPLPLTALTTLPAKVAEADRGVKRSPTARRKLWEIAHKHHCPVIGTCLQVDELRHVAKKTGCTSRHCLSDYEVHVAFVSAASEKNALSVALQRLLERKYATAVRRFARAKSGDDLERLWDEALAEGQVQGALWAIMTHPHADAEMCALAYADVHMLSHQIGAGLSADREALTTARENLARLRRERDAERERMARKLSDRDAQIARLEHRLQQLGDVDQQLAAARKQIALLESDAERQRPRAELRRLTADLRAVRKRAEMAEAEMEKQQRRADVAEQRRDALHAELADREQTIHALERLLTRPEGEGEGDGGGCDGDCAQCANRATTINGVDLCGRRILCVGGRGSLNSHYRDLVQRCNGRLIRHDGGLEDSRQRLEALLSSADAVVCPADCVSHDAYLRTKRYCKRNDKPCVLLERSGVGAFAKALSQLATAERPWAMPAVTAEQRGGGL
jgi:hypothetical protein